MECGAPLDCGHGCSLKCHDHTMTHVCKKIVPKQLKCGHSMVRTLSFNLPQLIFHFV
jgi:hypothetical protein